MIDRFATGLAGVDMRLEAGAIRYVPCRSIVCGVGILTVVPKRASLAFGR